MKVAVSYENEQIFQHFGKTEEFKIYTIENDAVTASEVIASAGEGHSALAGFLADQGVEVVICGGIGEGAKTALTEAGIVIYAGVSGPADEAVEWLIKGELDELDEPTCNHHDEGGCGHEGGCGGCSGCHSSGPAFEGKNVGKVCRVHYQGTFNDGTQFDSSYDRGEPIEFTCGARQMILGFDKAVANMEVGEIVNVHLMPAEAYGMPNPNAIFEVPIEELPGAEDVQVGESVYLTDVSGKQFAVTVAKKDDKTITFDANHEMAGKELNFKIELIECK